MDNGIKQFCEIVRFRSIENRKAIHCLHLREQVLSPAMSILRQELDSMVRTIYLLSVKSEGERERLVQATFNGKPWTVRTKTGKLKKVTDRDMVELAQQLQGWTRSVYKFGCSFIHLSDFHNHNVSNPFSRLPTEEQQNILDHLRHYHGGPSSDHPDMAELLSYVPRVFEKISSNLECYLKELDGGKSKE